jgi:hypothetical protein
VEYFIAVVYFRVLFMFVGIVWFDLFVCGALGSLSYARQVLYHCSTPAQFIYIYLKQDTVQWVLLRFFLKHAMIYIVHIIVQIYSNFGV